MVMLSPFHYIFCSYLVHANRGLAYVQDFPFVGFAINGDGNPLDRITHEILQGLIEPSPYDRHIERRQIEINDIASSSNRQSERRQTFDATALGEYSRINFAPVRIKRRT